MPCFIDDSFVAEWNAAYAECDEDDYERLVGKISSQVGKTGTLTSDLFEQIYDWKAARAKGYVDWKRFPKYAAAFRNALRKEKRENDMDAIGEDAKDAKVEALDDLPGIGVPVASTVLHMRYPNVFPIVDVRTVEVFQACGCLDASRKFSFYSQTVKGFRQFRAVFARHLSKLKKRWTLREFDRALFAYHKRGESGCR